MLAEMGVAIKKDGVTIGVFSPKKVSSSSCNCFFHKGNI